MRALAILSLIAIASSSLAKTPRARHAPAAPKLDAPEVLFTFDDGPSLDKTPKVLDILDAHHIKAVFFVNGWHFLGARPSEEKARALLRQELARGHAVGNHTVHHYFLCGKVYSQQAAQEIEENATLIEQAIGMRPDLYRTPYGAHCKKLARTLAGLGVRHTGWDIDPQDWKVRNAAKIEAFVEKELLRLRGRAIVLFHDVQGETVKALPRILDWLDQENARRLADKSRPRIKILDYAWLLPPHPLVPPPLDALGRLLIGFVGRALAAPAAFWPQLAWLSGQV